MNGEMAVSRRDRLLGGLAAGCAAAIGVAFVVGCVFGVVIGFGSHVDPISARRVYDVMPAGAILGIGIFAVLVATPIAVGVTAIVGVPLFSLLDRRGYRAVGAHVGAGFLMAVVAAGLLAGSHYIWGFFDGALVLLAVLASAIAGPVAGFVVWRALQP
ncbi:MAG: hypothetical protein JSS86_00170 [Cyanobacteria bacterium SZAS LIN-2]|nr:hypothetical protein [Cyanobacteria bacterium SZAS LIN-2]